MPESESGALSSLLQAEVYKDQFTKTGDAIASPESIATKITEAR